MKRLLTAGLLAIISLPTYSGELLYENHGCTPVVAAAVEPIRKAVRDGLGLRVYMKAMRPDGTYSEYGTELTAYRTDLPVVVALIPMRPIIDDKANNVLASGWVTGSIDSNGWYVHGTYRMGDKRKIVKAHAPQCFDIKWFSIGSKPLDMDKTPQPKGESHVVE